MPVEKGVAGAAKKLEAQRGASASGESKITMIRRAVQRFGETRQSSAAVFAAGSKAPAIREKFANWMAQRRQAAVSSPRARLLAMVRQPFQRLGQARRLTLQKA